MGILTKITGGRGAHKRDDDDPAADEAEEALKDPSSNSSSSNKQQAKRPGIISLFTSSTPTPPVPTDSTYTSVPPPPPTPVSAPDNETQPESTTHGQDPKQEPTAGTVPVVASETVTVGAVDKHTTDAVETTTRDELYAYPTDIPSVAPPTTDATTTTATNTTTITTPAPAPNAQDAPPVHFTLPTLPEILDMFFDYSARLIDVHRLQCFNIVIHPLDLLTGVHVDDSKHSDITIPSLYMSHKDLTRAPLKKGHPRRPITVGKLAHGHWLIVCRRNVCFVVAFVINIYIYCYFV